MIALDTNVLVRILVADDQVQTKSAIDCIDNLGEGEGFVSDIVVCEVVWVLGRGYHHERLRIAHALAQLFAAKQLSFASPDRLYRALESYRCGKGDFADYLILEHGLEAGCAQLVTFDQCLLKEEKFQAP